MSNSENQPPNDPYGQQPPNPYEQQPPAQPDYGQPGYGGYGGYGGQPPVVYAHWGKRVGSYLIDAIVLMVGMIPFYIGYGMIVAAATESGAFDPNATTPAPALEISGGAVALMLVGGLLGLAVFVWNVCLKGGKTGWTIGKGALGIRLLNEQSGQPIGAGMAFVRQLAHILDALPCNIGYLWPLWDAKRQTFADKVIGSVVIEQPKG